MALVGKETIDDVNVNENENGKLRTKSLLKIFLKIGEFLNAILELNPDPAEAMKPAEDAEAGDKKEEKKEAADGEANEGGDADPEVKEKEEALKQPRMVSY